jgi:hypothetical protein
MDELERDPLVVRWTRHHGLRIPYRKWLGNRGHYEPDFLVELAGGDKELREVKGEHLLGDNNTQRKLRAGDDFCRQRGMKFKLVTKSIVDPSTWRPEPRIRAEDALPAARPTLAEDAFSPSRSGCLATVLALVAVATLAVAACLLLILR